MWSSLPIGVKWPAMAMVVCALAVALLSVFGTTWSWWALRQAATTAPTGVVTFAEVSTDPDRYRWEVWTLEGTLSSIGDRSARWSPANDEADAIWPLELNFVGPILQQSLEGQPITVVCRVGADQSIGGLYGSSFWIDLDACRDLTAQP